MQWIIKTLFVLILTVHLLPAQKFLDTQLKPLLKASISENQWAARQFIWKTIILNDNLKSEILPKLKLKSTLPDTIHYAVSRADDQTIYILLDEAPAKSTRFSYCIFLDGKLKIRSIDVLKYNERHGSEIDLPFFRAQFTGKKKPDEIRFNRTIQGISGATISSKSITYAVRDMLTLFQILMERKSGS